MILEDNVLMDKEEGIFINLLTGVKLILKKEKDKGQLINRKIIEEDIRKAFQENGLDIAACKQLKPTRTEINVFKILIAEYIKANKLCEDIKII